MVVVLFALCVGILASMASPSLSNAIAKAVGPLRLLFQVEQVLETTALCPFLRIMVSLEIRILPHFGTLVMVRVLACASVCVSLPMSRGRRKGIWKSESMGEQLIALIRNTTLIS